MTANVTYTTNLKLGKPDQGTNTGTWGTLVNAELINMVDEAFGYATQAITDGSSANTTLTMADGTTSVARNIFIEMTGALTFATTSLIVPANKKLYFIYNNTSGGFAVTVKVTGQTGVSVPNGKKIALVCNGTDVVVAENYLASLTLGAGLPVASGGTAVTSASLTAFNNITGYAATTVTGNTSAYNLVFSNTPTFTTPVLGVATATSINKVAFTAPATASTLTIADGKTLTASNTLSFVGTDGTTMTFPAASSVVGYKNIPVSGTVVVATALVVGDVGKVVILNTSGSVSVPASTFAAGDVISVVNNTAAGISNVCSAVTAYLGGTNTVVTAFTLASRGVCTIFFVTASVVFITGNVA